MITTSRDSPQVTVPSEISVAESLIMMMKENGASLEFSRALEAPFDHNLAATGSGASGSPAKNPSGKEKALR